MLTKEVLAELERLHREFAAEPPHPDIVGSMAWKLESGLRAHTLMLALLEHAEALLSTARLAEVYERALLDIRTGKRHEDNSHPLGEYASQAFRYHKMAADALDAARAATDAARRREGVE